jgi:hypothetical protein
MKSGKPSQNDKEELRKAKTKTEQARKTQTKKLPPESTPHNTLNTSSPS